MSRQSIVILNGSPPKSSFTSEPVRIDEWYTSPDHVVSFAVVSSMFAGRVFLEASIKLKPTENDWVKLWTKEYPSGEFFARETSTVGGNFTGRFVWIRVRIDRSYLLAEDAAPSILGMYGLIDRVLVNL